MNTRLRSEAPHGVPAQFCIGKRLPSAAALNAVLLVDAARWGKDLTVASIFSAAFHRAAQLATAYRNTRSLPQHFPVLAVK